MALAVMRPSSAPIPLASGAPRTVSALPASPEFLTQVQCRLRHLIHLTCDPITPAGHPSPELLTRAAQLTADLPLYQFLQPTSANPEALFGYTLYALTLDRLEYSITTHQTLATAVPRTAHFQQIHDAIATERQIILPLMVNVFWETYTEAAALLATGSGAAGLPHLRAFLRYGLLGSAPWLIDPDRAQSILHECAQPRTTLDPDAVAHVLHPDEYIACVACSILTPSVDEDLYLNGQKTPAFKRDQAHRRLLGARLRVQTLTAASVRLEARAVALHHANAALEQEVASLPREGNYLERKNKLRETLHHQRVEIARLRQTDDILRGRLLPLQQARLQQSSERLALSNGPPTPADLARQEARQIRRLARLGAQLKEPFLPFTLRDEFRPNAAAVISRQLLLEQLTELQRADPTIFQELTIPSSKAAHRLFLPYAPCVLILPSPGHLSFALAPRDHVESGCLVFPACLPRANLLPALLATVAADFRWDTSKEAAGIDWLTSDTLAAAYARVRWEYRKIPIETRERCGIYSKESDRKNFRRHYQLYISSAAEAGRRLFFACPEVYDAFTRYLPLPPGLQKLKRS